MKARLLVFALGVVVGAGLFVAVRLVVKGLPPEGIEIPEWAKGDMRPVQYTCPHDYVLLDFVEGEAVRVEAPARQLDEHGAVRALACVPVQLLPPELGSPG